MTSHTQITPAQLTRLVGTPDCPILVDICIDEDFDADPRLIPGAFRHPFREIGALAPRLAGRQVIVICQKGLKLSQGAAAVLRTHGVAARTLEGGNFGWCDAGLPLVPAAMIPERGAQGHTTWATGHRPGADRIACGWLIRRFIDRDARFLFVAPGEVPEVAPRFNATPFDVEGAAWSRRGERCTFDAMIEEFRLETDPLRRLATVIRGAVANRPDLAPEAAGLMAASLGLGRMFGDDLAQLEAGMTLYDALYRWADDGQEEGHDGRSARLEA